MKNDVGHDSRQFCRRRDRRRGSLYSVLLFCISILFLSPLFFHHVQAQDETDSVMLSGVVIYNDSRRPYPDCQLFFLQDSMVVAETVSDSDGTFFIPSMPTGNYKLYVKVKHFTMHQADLTIDGIAHLTVAVDTVVFRTLKAVTVNAAKYLLGPLLITSRHDKRLWGLTSGYRDANASVALPPDAHGNSDAGADDGLVFPLGMPWQVQMAYMTGKLGTRLITGPIWELVPDKVYKVDSTESKQNQDNEH